MGLLRVALLCHLSVVGAVRLATNVACLPSNAEEVVLDLSGARAHTAFPKGFPQADALPVAQARSCCTTTWAVREGGVWARLRCCQQPITQRARVRPKVTIARRQWARRPPARTSPKGSGLPHRASCRACAVFGNVASTADASRVTGTPGAIIDLHVETTTSYVAAINPSALHPCNGMRDVDGVNTFGEINLKGPGVDGATSSVGLTFTFNMVRVEGGVDTTNDQ